jgi:hypothetical protein
MLATESMTTRQISQEHGLSLGALARHKRNHMGAVFGVIREEHVEQQRAIERGRVGEVALTIRERLELAAKRTEETEKLAHEVVKEAREKGEHVAAAMAVRGLVAANGEFRQTLNVIGKVTGEIPTGAKVTFTIDLGGAKIDASADEMRQIVGQCQTFFERRHPELLEEFREFVRGSVQ